MKKYAKQALVGLLTISLSLTACTTAQLQKKYTTFDGCFRDQKVIATTGGAIVGALIGIAAGGRGDKAVALGAAAAVLGGIIGNRMAWNACLTAFPGRSETVILNDRTAAIGQTQGGTSQVAAKSLAIQDVRAEPLNFGRDLNISVRYMYISDRPAARDIKAKVSRNLTFKSKDGSVQEVPSSTEDVIQQGISKINFSIPTPSIEDAKELLATSDWTFKFVIEVEGLRQEQAIRLNVPLLSAGAAPAAAVQVSVPANQTPPQPEPAKPDSVTLERGSVIYRGPDTSRVLVRLAKASTAIVLNRIVQSKVDWVQIQLPDKREGWVKGSVR